MSQYIGKTISLVSNMDVRYVGTLHEINSVESTVSLNSVRSYGTEGRRGGIDEIPPSEHTYEYIIFRGSDVKDLKIADNAPPPPPPPQPFQDPAIIQVCLQREKRMNDENTWIFFISAEVCHAESYMLPSY